MNTETKETNAAILEHVGNSKEDDFNYVPVDFARKLERERDEARMALKHQSQNYISLYEAVIGDGCTTSDVKDVNEIARQHRAERDQLRKVCDELRHAAVCMCGKDCGVDAMKNYYQLPHVKDKNV
jgi:hypothetical protein